MSAETLTRSCRPSSDHLADVASHLRRIDVDRADDAEALARGHLPHHRRADRPEPDVQDLDRYSVCDAILTLCEHGMYRWDYSCRLRTLVPRGVRPVRLV